MMFRKVEKEEIKVGAVIIDSKGKSWEIKSIQGEYIHFTERTYYSTVHDVLSGFTVKNDKPTGIPIFDGKIGNTGLKLESEIIRNTSEILNTGNEPLILLSESGTKHDSGKLKPTLLLDDMPLAINEILKVLQFGAKKYSEGNWLKVDNGISRYRNAADRHRLAIDELDDESGLLHLAHEATSVLMLLELKLKEKRNAE